MICLIKESPRNEVLKDQLHFLPEKKGLVLKVKAFICIYKCCIKKVVIEIN